MNVFTAPWFYWSMIIAAGLPTVLVLLTELQHALERRGSFLSRPIGLLRTLIVPLGALLLLLTQTSDISIEATPMRILSTIFGVLILIMVLSGVSATVFDNAPRGSWRRRMPTIFVDVARFAIIAVGVAMIFAYVWGANVGGLFTALGISSIVLGLTLQNSVGQIISGLLLLFEQPFQIGDWVETTSAKGRVVEVNWRATHINTGSGLEIIPNSVLAGQAFANLSRPAGGHTITVPAKFSGGDAPDEVCDLLTDVASTLPHLHPEGRPTAIANSSTDYTVTIPVRSPPTTSKRVRRSSAGSGTPPAAPVFGSTGWRTTSTPPNGAPMPCARWPPSCGPAAPNSKHCCPMSWSPAMATARRCSAAARSPRRCPLWSRAGSGWWSPAPTAPWSR